jgi:hypothetical protein
VIEIGVSVEEKMVSRIEQQPKEEENASALVKSCHIEI